MFNNLNVDSLKVFARKLNLTKTLTRRDELKTALDKELRSNLPGVVARLSETEHMALEQAVHNGGTVAHESFKAMYGVEMPNLESWTYHRKDVSLLLMFGECLSGCFVVSEGLRESLQRIIPEPARPAVSIVDAIPEIYHPVKTGWREAAPRPVRIYESSETAPLELRSVLLLVRSGKLLVTDKSLRPTEASVRLIAHCLVAPDFNAEDAPQASGSHRVEAVGNFRAHGWGVLVQQCGWARPRRGILALTESGHRTLRCSTPEILKEAIDSLRDDTHFDEFNRVNHIRGQSGRGKRYLTDPGERRSSILESVSNWPIGKWIKFDEAWRFLLASGNNFLLTSEAVTLYFEEQQYGHLGATERILPRIYLRVFLMESLATLGIIDIAYCYPHGLWPELEDRWGTDEMDFCSRYDGLLYVRLNALGAYCLNVTSKYEPASVRQASPWEVLGNGEIIPPEDPSPSDAYLLDGWAIRDSQGAWWLDASRVLDCLASGSSITDISRFLVDKSQNELPEALEGWLSGIAAKASAVKGIEQALLIEMCDEATAAAIARHDDAGTLSRHAGGKYLVVSTRNLRAFRNALKKLGYVLPEKELQG
ncbi:MAG: hypothetical protein JXA73_04945 [Acidobacteria bacterium]|nr:hypothetical protein [Acidobacteriota bacterium]